MVVVLDDWEGRWAAAPELDRVRAVAEVRVFGDRLERDALVREARDATVLVLNRERTKVDAALLAALPALRTIVSTGLGLNHVDRAAAQARGVQVVPTGGDSTAAVVEQTFALILAATKRLPELDAGLRAGRFPEATIVGDLHGKRLGVAGIGNIGAGVARVGQAFGMEVAGWSPHLDEAKAATLGIERRATLSELAASSDVFAVCLRLAPETRGLISAAVVDALPAGAIFVNTARAEITDAAALLARAERGELLVALDVYDDEPSIDPRYRGLAGALSPHVGWKSDRTWTTFVRVGVEKVLQALSAP